jgi:hypothetical protein
MPEKEEASTSKRGLTFVALLLVSLPLFYFLSVGPVCLILDKTNGFGGVITKEMVREIYWPIVWLDDNTFMEKPIEFYLRLWFVN